MVTPSGPLHVITQKVEAMPKETLKKFSIARLSILGESGDVDANLEPNLTPQKLKRMYEEMLRLREFDHRCIALQRQGRMGTFAGAIGQEAIHIGSAAALQTDDWMVPSFREQGVYLFRGISPKTLFLFFMGSEEGNRLPQASRSLPNCVPCGTQALHAVGLAMSEKIKKQPGAVITYFGDGATSEGDLHEAMNFASVAQAPLVFFCQNNQFAISTPITLQCHSSTLAQRALGYDMPGLVVDGNDILAVYLATREAMERARSGQGPSFLEALCYRMGAHTTSDDPSRYREETEVSAWRLKDPVGRFEKYLFNKNILQEGEKERMQQRFSEEMKTQAIEAEAICERLSTEEMFSYLFKNMPEMLKEQRVDMLHQTQPEAEGISHG
jgi:pyruvate dehydrogenase E1 component alpha subunit